MCAIQFVQSRVTALGLEQLIAAEVEVRVRGAVAASSGVAGGIAVVSSASLQGWIRYVRNQNEPFAR
jgi:hypothetical protein